MKRLMLLLLLVLVALPATVSAQNRWNFSGVFPSDSARVVRNTLPAEFNLSTDRYIRQPHGVGVDVDGKVWVLTFNTGASFVYADTVLNGDAAARPKIKSHTVGLIRIYNANGTENAMSPLVYGVQNGVRTDTLSVFCGNKDATSGRRICESRTGRGLRMAPDGLSVYVSLFDTIFRFDTKTGAMLGKVAPYAGEAGARASLTAVGIDGSGNVYTRAVAATAAGKIYDKTLKQTLGTYGTPDKFAVARTLEVSRDGNKIYYAGYTANSIQLFKRASDLDPFPANPDTVLKGIASEAIAINPANGNVWVGAGGNPGSSKGPNGYTSLATSYQPMTYYGFNAAQIEAQARPTRVDSMVMRGPHAAAASLRGIAFNTGGTMAYTLRYDDSNGGNIQRFMFGTVAVEQVDAALSGLAARVFPNPARGFANVEFEVATPGRVTVKVYDAVGREVATLVNDDLVGGTYRAGFDAANLPSGTYLYRVNAAGRTASGTLVLVQ